MPLAVAPVASHLFGKTVGAVHQLVVLEANVELVLTAVILLQATAVGEQRAATVLIGLEPEHQRVVLLGGAVQGIARQLHTLVSLLQTQRQAAWHSPADVHQFSVGALGMVDDVIARAFVHRVVIYQVLLIARQTVAAVGRSDEAAVHGGVPQAGLHHATFVVLNIRAVALVVATEDERTGTRIESGQLAGANLYTTVEEGHGAVRLVHDESHLCEAFLHDSGFRREGLVVDHGLQLEVTGQPQLQLLAVCAV